MASTWAGSEAPHPAVYPKSRCEGVGRAYRHALFLFFFFFFWGGGGFFFGGVLHPADGHETHHCRDKMLRSHQQVPTVTLTRPRVDVTQLPAVRAAHRQRAAEGRKVSYTDFICGPPRRRFVFTLSPQFRHFVGESIVLGAVITMGVAVALRGGDEVPVVRRADEVSVRQIAAATRELAELVRACS